MIGDILRKEREKQRMTIEDIENGTSIRASYIEAIEKGEYDKMPGRVYAKGFIKNYANFLKLNGDEIVKQFVAEVSPAVEPVEIEVDKEDGKKTAFSVSGKRIGISDEGFSIGNYLSANAILAAIIAVVVVVGGIFYYTKDSGTEIAKTDVKTQETKPAAQTQTPAAPAQPAAAPNNQVSAAPAPQVDGVNVQATFSDDCWMLVTVDGAVVYEGVINAGQVMDWKGNDNVNFRIGNAGAVDFVMNGQNFGKLGEEGDVVDKTFSK
ncbi:MAG: helix-turn-helix domain-containing protein [Selenomonadaceae bacterium]|nr:helix-turn-helix domain-containing protein [Selenomonadaceae bacterium]